MHNDFAGGLGLSYFGVAMMQKSSISSLLWLHRSQLAVIASSGDGTLIVMT